MVSHHVYWTGIASRAHLIYGASWIRQLLGEIRVSVFPLRRFLDAPILDLDDVRAAVPEHVEVTAFDAHAPLAAGERATLLSVGAVGIKPWLRLRRVLGVRRMPVVVTDEGFGTYGDFSTRRAAWQREGVREPWLSVRAGAVTTASSLLTSRRWHLHREVAGRWELNVPIASEFHRYAQRTRSDGGAVFLTQPWPELGVLDEQSYLEHIDAVAQACGEAGLPFTVHPHPAEPHERYDAWDVHRMRGLAECDPQSVNATVLLGATSTAMLNVAAVHGVPTVRVATPELVRVTRGHSRRQQSLLAQYTGHVVPVTELGGKLSGLDPTAEKGWD